MLLDENGQPKQLVENLKVIVDVIYNSQTGKSVTAGPGESEQLRMLFENGLPVTHRWSGLLFKVTRAGLWVDRCREWPGHLAMGSAGWFTLVDFQQRPQPVG